MKTISLILIFLNTTVTASSSVNTDRTGCGQKMKRKSHRLLIWTTAKYSANVAIYYNN